MKKYGCRNKQGVCKSCVRQNSDRLEDQVKDYIKYHSTPKYKEHITAAIQALEKI